MRQCSARSGAFLDEAIRLSSRLSRYSVLTDKQNQRFAGNIWEETNEAVSVHSGPGGRAVGGRSSMTPGVTMRLKRPDERVQIA